MAHLLKSSFRPQFNSSISVIRRLSTSSPLKKLESEEVRIPVPWGHIAGKWWGPKTVRPILTIHGWLDNCASFDRLIPVLPNHLSYLTIDLPVHGHSSHLPQGAIYHLDHFLYMCHLIRDHYEWDKLSMLGHSLGSQISFVYSSLYRDLCDFIVGIDVLRPVIATPKQLYSFKKISLERLVKEEMLKFSKPSEVHTYTEDGLLSKIVKSSGDSISLETAKLIMARGGRESTPGSNLYCFTRDERLKHYNLGPYDRHMLYEMIKMHKTPYLYIKASKSPYYEEKKHFDESVDALKKTNGDFEWHYVEGTHHLHLEDPESIAETISNFINKHRSIG